MNEIIENPILNWISVFKLEVGLETEKRVRELSVLLKELNMTP